MPANFESIRGFQIFFQIFSGDDSSVPEGAMSASKIALYKTPSVGY